MKLYKSFFSMALVAITALFAGCSTDGYWDKYDASQDAKYSFDKKALSVSFTPSDVLNEINVTVTRTNSSEASTLPVTADFGGAEELSGPSEITFAAGSQTANYTIQVGELTIGKSYQVKIYFDKADASISGFNVISVTIMKDYNWLDAGSVRFYSSWSGTITEEGFVGSGVKVAVQCAEGGNGLYRLVSPYYYSEKAAGSDAKLTLGHHIQFMVDPATGEAKNLVGTFQSMGEYVSGYGDFYLGNIAAYNCKIVNKGNVYQYLGLLAYDDGTGKYLYDYETAAFIWDDGYPW